jgi:predicted enzyme related to lactoylglutathione lyase
MDKVVHFEIPADDVERAKGFYGAVFGWQLDTQPIGEGEYTSVVTTAIDPETYAPTEPGGINGGMMRRSADTPSPVITVGVEDIDRSLKEVEANGGTVVTPRTPIPDMGAFAYFKDPEGNVMGLWETAR